MRAAFALWLFSVGLLALVFSFLQAPDMLCTGGYLHRGLVLALDVLATWSLLSGARSLLRL